MSLVVRKPALCICENKDADHLRGDGEADHGLCFRYTDSKIPLLPKSEISSLSPFSMAVQPGLCGTRSKPRRPDFSQRGSNNLMVSLSALQKSICGLKTETFTCTPGQEISIIKVFYGRVPPIDINFCNQYRSPIPSNTNCVGDPTAVSYVSNLCDKKQNCAVKNDWTQLGKDPCPGVPKYLQIDYQCVSKTTTSKTTSTPITSSTTPTTTPSTTPTTRQTTPTTTKTTPSTSTRLTTRRTTLKTTTATSKLDRQLTLMSNNAIRKKDSINKF